MKRWISSILAAILLFAAFVPAAGAAEAGPAPALVGAGNGSDAHIMLTFDKPLTALADSGYTSVTLDAAKFTLSGAGGITVQYAMAYGYHVSLGLSDRLGDLPAVTLDIAAGAVTSSAGAANAAVSGYKIQTLAGMVAILEAMNAKNANPVIGDVAKYAGSQGAGNVAGGPGIGSDDIRFLLGLLGRSDSEKTVLAEAVGKAEMMLVSSDYAHVTGEPRTELQARVAAAQETLGAPDSVLYDYGVAGLALGKAYDAFVRQPQLPVEPQLQLIGSNPEVGLAHTLETWAANRLYVPLGMTVNELMLEVASRYPFEVRESATSSTVVDGDATLTKSMVVVLDAPGSKMYVICPQAAVSDIAGLHAALGNEAVATVRLASDIIAPQESIAANDKELRAYTNVRLEVGGMIGYLSRMSGITLAGHADNEEELLALVNNSFFKEIAAEGIGNYSGVLQAQRDMLGNFFFAKGRTAYVGNYEHLIDALAARDIDTVYLVSEVAAPYNSGQLVFPADRYINLAASVPRKLKANGIVNAPDASRLTNVDLIDMSGLTGFISDFSNGEGYVSIDVQFSEEISEAVRGQATAEILDRIVVDFGGFGGKTTFVPGQNQISVYWSETNTVNFHFFAGLFPPQAVEIYFKDGVIRGISDTALQTNPVVYESNHGLLMAEIENVAYNASNSVETFDIRFSKELSEDTLALPVEGAWELIDMIMTVNDEATDSTNLEDVDVAWDLLDEQVLHVSLNGQLTLSSWEYLYVMLSGSAVAKDGSELASTTLYYDYIPSPGEIEFSESYGEFYVPYGMTVAEFKDYLSLNEPNAALLYEDVGIADETEPVTNGMAVDLNATGGQADEYRILVHGMAFSIKDVRYWIEETDVDAVTIAASYDTYTGGELYIVRPVRLRSASPIEIYVDGLAFDGMQTDYLTIYEEVNVVVTVNNDAQIISLVEVSAITHLLVTITGYEGIYVRNTSAEKHHYKDVDNGRALVYDDESLADALEDETITTLYIAGDITWPAGETLYIPPWITHLKAEETRTIIADAIVRDEDLNVSNKITLVQLDTTPPFISGTIVDMGAGTVTVIVSEAATVYLVADNYEIVDAATLAADALHALSTTSETAVFTGFGSDNVGETYRAYAVDIAGNISASSNVITISY